MTAPLAFAAFGYGVTPFLHNLGAQLVGFVARFAKRVIAVAADAYPTATPGDVRAVGPVRRAVGSDLQDDPRRPTSDGVTARLFK